MDNDIVRIEQQRARTWADLACGPAAQQALSDFATRLYREAFGDAELFELDFGETVFLFDTFAADDGREQRTVAAWRIVPKRPLARDRSRQAGYPLHASLIAAGYERGHLIARAPDCAGLRRPARYQPVPASLAGQPGAQRGR